jgi:hypothetical protein
MYAGPNDDIAHEPTAAGNLRNIASDDRYAVASPMTETYAHD